jgi:DNA-binding LacI/PurR family transcriptional regulator
MIDRDDHPVVKCDRVVTDDAVGQLATTHLIEQGRGAIAHILDRRSCTRSAVPMGIAPR